MNYWQYDYDYMKLSDANNNEQLEVIGLESNVEYLERLHSLGIMEGCAICPLRNQDSTMIVDVRGCRYALGKEITECILVRRL
jgi:Fe2+ transport system protein FeoA